MENIFSKVFQRPCSLMMALLLVLVSTVAGAQSLLRVSDDSYKRGLDRFKKGDMTGAIEEFDQALDAYLSNRAAYGAGNANGRASDDLEGVAVDYGDLVVHVPRAAAIYQNRGLARLRLGETEAAIGDFDESIKLAPRNAGVYLYRGIAIQTKGDLESAIADYDRAIGLYPRYAEAWYNRGVAKRDKGVSDEALTDFNQALTINPKLTDALVNRAAVYYDKGNLKSALDDCNQAIKIE